MTLRKQLNDSNLLCKAWLSIYSSKDKRRRKHSKGIDKISIADFEKNKEVYLSQLLLELGSNKYKCQPFYGFAQEKENIRPEINKPSFRLLASPSVRDRVIQKAMLVKINPVIFPYINTKVSYCGIKKNILSSRSDKDSLNTKKAFLKIIDLFKAGNFYVFKSDIKKFYDNVNKDLLTEILDSLLKRDPSLIPLLKQVIYFDIGNKVDFTGKKAELLPNNPKLGIPQGSALSQVLANIYLAGFDNNMKNHYGDRFIRYIDDFIVFSKNKEEAEVSRNLAIKYLKNLGLELSDNIEKTMTVNLKSADIKFLGLRISKEKITWKFNVKKTRNWAKDVLNKSNDSYRNMGSFKEVVESMNNRIKGQANYLKYYHAEEILQEINRVIRDFKNPGKDPRNFYKGLNVIDLKLMKPIISREDWRAIFT